MEKDDLRDRLGRIEDFIESRKKWQDLAKHPEWPMFLKSMTRLKYKALLDLGSAKNQEVVEYKEFYNAICLIVGTIEENTRFDDLETALLEKELTAEEIEIIESQEDFERRPVQIGGAL